MRYKMTFMYDGSNYYGFQKQPSHKTVEKMILGALKNVYKKDIKITASGRTDKGVHALAQVVHFDTDIKIPVSRLKLALNRHLPLDIRIKNIAEVDADFHARFSAVKKTYKYIIVNEYNLFKRNYETFIKAELDIDKMKEALKLFVGKHDFFAFSVYVKDKPTIKTIYDAKITQKNGKIIVTITGDNFLRHMIRKMIGTLIEIGKGKKDKEIITKMFLTKDSSLCSKTASPNGLYLTEVFY